MSHLDLSPYLDSPPRPGNQDSPPLFSKERGETPNVRGGGEYFKYDNKLFHLLMFLFKRIPLYILIRQGLGSCQ
jgi:hypothetical protein